MWYRARFALLVCVSLVVLLNRTTLADPVRVYDNSATATKSILPDSFCPDGFWPFLAFFDPEHPGLDQMGNQITLTGTQRQVVEFDLYLSSTKPVDLDSVNLAFYNNDGLLLNGYYGAPGTQIWSGTTPAKVTVNGPTVVKFYLDNITVPDTFTWVASAWVPSDNGDVNMSAGLATYDVSDPLAKGSSTGSYWDRGIDGTWWYQDFGGDPPADFGATIWAVPEPASLTLLVLGGLGLLRKRRSSK